jgi:hypothetical protein
MAYSVFLAFASVAGNSHLAGHPICMSTGKGYHNGIDHCIVLEFALNHVNSMFGDDNPIRSRVN